MDNSWRLGDAQALADHYPYTFYKPSPEAIARLRIGDLAKLIFEFDSDDPQAPGAERMWVLITDIHDNHRFSGSLENIPLYIKDLRAHDPVRFEARHIMGVQIPDPVSSLADKYLPRCFVTRKVLSDGEPVGLLYRETPESEDDSGWRILAGNEDQTYLDDPDNAAYVSLGAVLTEDDSFIGLLDREVGARFVRDGNGAFIEQSEPPVSTA